MEYFFNLPVILKIFTSLLIILLGNRYLKNMAFSVALATVVLAFWSGQSLYTSWEIASVRIFSPSEAVLYVVVYLVIALSSQMKATGTMTTMVHSIGSRLSNRTSMAVLPAVIGLLPMPGGALFSAPLVNTCQGADELTGVTKTQINYWFRHMWEYWWPLYPGVLLAIDLSGLPILRYILFMAPLTLFYILGGYLFLLRRIPKGAREKGTIPVKGLFKSTLPILITMAVFGVLEALFPALGKFSKYVPIGIGLVTAMVVLQIQSPLEKKHWKKILFSSQSLSLVLLIVMIRTYGAFIEAPLPGGQILMDVMRAELAAWGIPVFLFVALIPFFSGAVMGVAVGTVGASFPIVLSLLGSDPPPGILMSTVMIAFAFGHAGQLLSPVHVCLVVSNQYFKAGLLPSLRGLLLPVATMLGGAYLISRVLLLVF